MRAKNRFVKNGTANFGRNILTEISGPPPEVIPNIQVGRNRNGPGFPFEFPPKFPESLAQWKAPDLCSDKNEWKAKNAIFSRASQVIWTLDHVKLTHSSYFEVL